MKILGGFKGEAVGMREILEKRKCWRKLQIEIL